MKVLMLTHRLPYAPNRGDRRRAYHLLRFLGTRFEMHLVSLVHDDAEASRASAMTDLAASVSIARPSRMASLLRASVALAGTRPLTHVLLDAPHLHRAIERVVERVRPDVVLAFESGLAPYALQPPLDRLPLVLDLVDVDSQKWRAYTDRSRPPLGWVYRREARCLSAFEARAARAASSTMVVNERERAALAAIAPDAHGVVVPNGIDLEELQSPYPPANEERVLFCGVMNYRPNHDGAVWFLRAVWPRVRAARPSATLCIAGTAPRSSLRRLAQGAGAVEVTGHVEDVRPYYWQAAVFVAPIHVARGVQNKVLDAAAAGLPSVVTSAVRDGLPGELARACIVADSAEDFAAAVINLLGRSAEERRARASAAALSALSWPRQLAAVPGLLDAACCATAQPKPLFSDTVLAAESQHRLPV